MDLKTFAERCCNREVSKEEFNNFLDPNISKLSKQTLQEKNRTYQFYFDNNEEQIVALTFVELGEMKYWLTPL